MNLELLIVDNFYQNPDDMREYALKQSFEASENYPRKRYPGRRSRPYLPDHLKSSIQYWMRPVGQITNWFEEYGYTGAFQIATAKDQTWIHADYGNKWSGVCYLTPDAPLSAGTCLYRHKASGEYSRTTRDHEEFDKTKWDVVDRIGNKYNRLIIYRGDLFHASSDYFGENLLDGRLFQTFFFDTE